MTAKEMTEEEMYAAILAKLDDMGKKMDDTNQKLEKMNTKMCSFSPTSASKPATSSSASPTPSSTSSPPRDVAPVVSIATTELPSAALARCSTAGPNQDAHVLVPAGSFSASPTASPTSSTPPDATVVVPTTIPELPSEAPTRCSTPSSNPAAQVPVPAATPSASSASPTSSSTPGAATDVPVATSKLPPSSPVRCSVLGLYHAADVPESMTTTSTPSSASSTFTRYQDVCLTDPSTISRYPLVAHSNCLMPVLYHATCGPVSLVPDAGNNKALDPITEHVQMSECLELHQPWPPPAVALVPDNVVQRPSPWPSFKFSWQCVLLQMKAPWHWLKFCQSKVQLLSPWPPPTQMEIVDSGAGMRPRPWPTFSFYQFGMLTIQQWFQNWAGSEDLHLAWCPSGSAIVVSITYSMTRAICCSDPNLSVVSKSGEHQFELKSLSESDGQMVQISTWKEINSEYIMHDHLLKLELDDNKENAQAAMLLMLHLRASCLSVCSTELTVLLKAVELCLIPWSHMEKSWGKSVFAISMHEWVTVGVLAWMRWCFHREQISVIHWLSGSDGEGLVTVTGSAFWEVTLRLSLEAHAVHVIWYSGWVKFPQQPVLSLLPFGVDEVQISILWDSGGLFCNFKATISALNAYHGQAPILISWVHARCLTIAGETKSGQQIFKQDEARMQEIKIEQYLYCGQATKLVRWCRNSKASYSSVMESCTAQTQLVMHQSIGNYWSSGKAYLDDEKYFANSKEAIQQLRLGYLQLPQNSGDRIIHCLMSLNCWFSRNWRKVSAVHQTWFQARNQAVTQSRNDVHKPWDLGTKCITHILDSLQLGYWWFKYLMFDQCKSLRCQIETALCLNSEASNCKVTQFLLKATRLLKNSDQGGNFQRRLPVLPNQTQYLANATGSGCIAATAWRQAVFQAGKNVRNMMMWLAGLTKEYGLGLELGLVCKPRRKNDAA